MNNIDLMNFWIESSDEDYTVMQVLYNKKNSWSLFFWTSSNRKTFKRVIC